MNFIAAIILMTVPNEALACMIFREVLQKNNWARLFLDSTPKLFDLSGKLMDRLKTELPRLYAHLQSNDIFLEVLLASPMMTLFANLVSFSEATHIMNMFILDGESYVMELIFNCYRNLEVKVLLIKDPFEIQAYLSTQIYEDALKQGLFYF